MGKLLSFQTPNIAVGPSPKFVLTLKYCSGFAAGDALIAPGCDNKQQRPVEMPVKSVLQ